MIKIFKGIGFTFLLSMLLVSCKKDESSSEPTTSSPTPNTQVTTDAVLVNELKSKAFTYYQNDSINLLMAKGNSPHGSFKLKFNAIAQSSLDATTGKLPQGKTFADGSLIVKETFSGNGNPGLVAVMKKESSNANAAGGWVWNEIAANGVSIVYSVNLKGVGCIGCHSGNTNRDLVTSFDLH